MSLSTDTAGPFDVRTEDLKQIDAGQAVDLFRQLLVIEAAKVGAPITAVNVPADINTADGGIDADVASLAGQALPAGLIFGGQAYYQIKTGKFSASVPSEIRALLVQPKHAAGNAVPTKDQLQPRVRACFDNGGTFVVVLFGAEVVGTEENHGVLQGQRTLTITPQLLHVSMWKSWFERYEKLVDVIQLRAGLNARAQSHFDAMLSYAKESPAATALAQRLLGKGGKFESLAGFLAPGGTGLFFAVAQANPKAALRRFADALGRESVDARKQFQGDGRRTAVHRLEQLAVPRETFFEAADCLLLLAESENESWSNNATGIFVSLFGLGYDKLAASEVAPYEKLRYLDGLLHSDTDFYRQIAVRALSESLEPFISRTAIEETIGLRRLPDRWMPKTVAELHDSYVAHVDLLETSLGFLPPQEALVGVEKRLTLLAWLL